VTNRLLLVQAFWEGRARALMWPAGCAMRRGLPLLAADLHERGLEILLRLQAERPS